jgi:hypothetical protein
MRKFAPPPGMREVTDTRFVAFTAEGESAQGVLGRDEWRGEARYTLRGADGRCRFLPNHAHLCQLLENVPSGDFVHVEFLGVKPLTGGRELRLYGVAAASANDQGDDHDAAPPHTEEDVPPEREGWEEEDDAP